MNTRKRGMAYTCAVCAFLYPNTSVLHMTELLAFKTSDWQFDVFVDINQMVINTNPSCQKEVSSFGIILLASPSSG